MIQGIRLDTSNLDLLEQNCTDEFSVNLTKEGRNFERLLNFVFDVISLTIFIADIISDLILSYTYYSQGQLIEFTLTLLFCVIPLLIVNLTSFLWMWRDRKYFQLYFSDREWILIILFHIVQLGPVIRYLRKLKLYYKVNKNPENRFIEESLLREATDTSFFTMLEGFLESAPEGVLQLYIVAKNSLTKGWYSEIGIIQTWSIISSLFCSSWSMTSYIKDIRSSAENKNNFTWKSRFVFFLWHFFTVTARLLAIALFSSVFGKWIVLTCSIRWLIMTTVIFVFHTPLDNNYWLNILFKILFGGVFLFTFLNVEDEPTKKKHIMFYFYDFTENIIYIILWYSYLQKFTLFFYVSLGIFFSSMIIGLCFMYLYYDVCHPTLDPRLNDQVTKYEELPERVDEEIDTVI